MQNMKVNNWFNNKSAKNIDFLILGGILLFCLIYRIIYFCVINENMLFYNSESVLYFTSGIFDLYRTPIYPLIIKFFESISKDNLVSNLIGFQQVLSFLSIIPFFYFLRNTLKNRTIIIITTLIYACYPYLLKQNMNINPESLCIVGSTFILYLFSLYIKKPQSYTAFCLGFFPFILIMLKPTYLIALCIIFLFFITRFLYYKNERKILYWGMSGLFIAVLGVFGYSAMNKKCNGEFTLSKISLNNSLTNIVISGAYKYGGDEELISIVDSTKQDGSYVSVFMLNNQCVDSYKVANEKFPENLVPSGDMEFCMSIPDTDNYSHERLNKFVKQSQYTKSYFKYVAKRLVYIFSTYNILLSLGLLFHSIMIFLLFLKYKKIYWILSFSILFIVGQLFTIAVGAIGDWGRLILPIYPFIILIFSSFVDLMVFSREKLVDTMQENSQNLSQ